MSAEEEKIRKANERWLKTKKKPANRKPLPFKLTSPFPKKKKKYD